MDINNVIQLALKYHRGKNYQHAESLYRQILKDDPGNVQILNYLGNVFQDQRKYDEAIDCFQRALRLNPAYAGSYYHLGTVFEALGHLDQAMQYYEQGIRCDPDFIGSYNNLGNVYRKLERLDEAIPYFQKAIEVHPAFWGCYYNLGEVYQAKVLDDNAIACYQKVLQLNPHHIPTMNNLALILLERKHIDEALAFCQQAIRLQPDYGEPHFTKALIMLLKGEFQAGWEEYEWRWKAQDAEPWQRFFDQPVWNGLPMKDKTLFVYSEQGVGDEIMFASCIPDVMNQTETCLLECDRRLIPLFSRSFPKAGILERTGADNPANGNQKTMPFFDLVSAIGSLPLYVRPNLSCFPHQRFYLTPDHEKVDEWNRRMNSLPDGLRVGISWKGGKDPRERKIRSIRLKQWEEILLLKGITFINLQYGASEEEITEVSESLYVKIYNWEEADPLKDLDYFAAQISALDLVISVDNVTVHMAGALGVPVWTLLPYSPNWRWMLDREDTPWYPSMRLFRQPAFGDWETVMTTVCQELYNLKHD
jgi:tetratricopeptide (TPR) repeat protein